MQNDTLSDSTLWDRVRLVLMATLVATIGIMALGQVNVAAQEYPSQPATGRIYLFIEVEADLTALPATWDFALSSEQPGCTDRTISARVETIDSPFFPTADNGGGTSVRLIDDDGADCQYTLNPINLPANYLPTPPQMVMFEGGEPNAYMQFVHRDPNAPTQLLIENEVSSDDENQELPPTWTFEISSDQPGCTNTTESLPSSERHLILTVADADDNGEPCTYVIAEIDLPSLWLQPAPQIRTTTDSDLNPTFKNLNLAVPGLIYVNVFVNSGFDRLPATWDFALSSPQPGCTNATFNLDATPPMSISHGPKYVPGEFRVAASDESGELCQYRISQVNVSEDWTQTPDVTFTFSGVNDVTFDQEPTPDYPSGPATSPTPVPSSPGAVPPTTSTIPTSGATTFSCPAGFTSTGAGASKICSRAVAATESTAAIAVPSLAPAPAAPVVVAAQRYGFGEELPSARVATPTLAHTGSTTALLSYVAVALLAAGAIVLGSRRSRPEPRPET